MSGTRASFTGSPTGISTNGFSFFGRPKISCKNRIGEGVCVSEYGRRGNSLVRDTLCTRATRDFAESKLRQKLTAKRNHRETPYTDEPFGYNYSGVASEHDYNSRTENNRSTSTQTRRQATTESPSTQKANVIAFPATKKETPRQKAKLSGIINQEQFDSLEI